MDPVVKTAAFPPMPPKGGDEGGGDAGGTGKRDIPKDHPYDPKSLKPLAKSLWAASVAMGHALTAYKHLSRLKSATISPDGRLGGRGYVMNVTDIRKRLYEACESLSSITDTLHDEISAPHWKPRLAELDENEAEDIERFVEESQGILDSPEEDAEDEAKEIEEENDGPGGTKKDKPAKKEELASKMPSGGDSSPEETPKASTPHKMREARVANSSLPVSTLPGGPRVEHLDREDGPPQTDTPTVDQWGLPSGREYDYPSPWDNDLSETASSGVPDASTDSTPTEAWDFGLGYGARGQGAGGYENPSGEGDNKGVWGPASGIPGTPPQSSGDTTPKIDKALNDHKARDLLPGDLDIPVARSDYYRGDRGNLVNTQSTLPGEPAPSGELAPSMMNTDYTSEDISTPYVRYDYTTHDYRKDPLHDWPQGKEDG